tara:strand:+ start:185843 stop:186421 length:579 start_codon:yes stop_codon:yes gene_type:complete
MCKDIEFTVVKRVRAFVAIFLAFLMLSFSVKGDELVTYFEYKGGYEVQQRDGFTVFIDAEFTEVSSELSIFKKKYLSVESMGLVQVKFFEQIEKVEGSEVVPFKPALTALIMANIPLELEYIEMFDTSLDAGFFVAKGDVLEGGLITFHGFTKPVLGKRFKKTIHIRFNGEFMSSRLGHMGGETLQQFLILE